MGYGTRLWTLAARTLIGAVHDEHPNVTIDLDGTTDDVGRLDYNLRLSQRSVEAVTRSGTSNAVDRSRVVGAKRRGPHALKDDVNWRVMVKFMTSAE
jgi:outer membrane protein OmpA-like peptidoglycan-associated protein